MLSKPKVTPILTYFWKEKNFFKSIIITIQPAYMYKYADYERESSEAAVVESPKSRRGHIALCGRVASTNI